MSEELREPPAGAQHLSLERLRSWEALEYGMFLHFGLTTFVVADGGMDREAYLGTYPSAQYAPDRLDVGQWVATAHDAGMKYAVLTAKHHNGHCLWPSEHTDYSVTTSSNTTDVVGSFVEACRNYGIAPGLYYSSLDEHHRFGSRTDFDLPDAKVDAPKELAYVTRKYFEFQMAQIEELLTRYGPIDELWIDIPGLLGPGGRQEQYEQVNRLSPGTIVVMNAGRNDGTKLDLGATWPTDVHTIESTLPESDPGSWHDRRVHGYDPWRSIAIDRDGARDYYIPGEACETMGLAYEWFRDETVPMKSEEELLALRLLCRARGVNLLLNVPPDKTGQIPREMADALARVRESTERATELGSKRDGEGVTEGSIPTPP